MSPAGWQVPWCRRRLPVTGLRTKRPLRTFTCSSKLPGVSPYPCCHGAQEDSLEHELFLRPLGHHDWTQVMAWAKASSRCILPPAALTHIQTAPSSTTTISRCGISGYRQHKRDESGVN